jgi:hypothetical protein
MYSEASNESSALPSPLISNPPKCCSPHSHEGATTAFPHSSSSSVPFFRCSVVRSFSSIAASVYDSHSKALIVLSQPRQESCQVRALFTVIMFKIVIRVNTNVTPIQVPALFPPPASASTNPVNDAKKQRNQEAQRRHRAKRKRVQEGPIDAERQRRVAFVLEGMRLLHERQLDGNGGVDDATRSNCVQYFCTIASDMTSKNPKFASIEDMPAMPAPSPQLAELLFGAKAPADPKQLPAPWPPTAWPTTTGPPASGSSSAELAAAAAIHEAWLASFSAVKSIASLLAINDATLLNNNTLMCETLASAMAGVLSRQP